MVIGGDWYHYVSFPYSYWLLDVVVGNWFLMLFLSFPMVPRNEAAKSLSWITSPALRCSNDAQQRNMLSPRHPRPRRPRPRLPLGIM